MTAPTLLVARDTVTRWEQGLRDLLPSLTDVSRDVVTIVADQMRNRVRLCEFDPQFERMELVRFDGGVREAARRSPQPRDGLLAVAVADVGKFLFVFLGISGVFVPHILFH